MHPGSKKMGAALFGQIIGTAPGGVPSYSSDYSSVNYDEFPDRSAFKHFVDGVYTGHKWQCVEFARRWLLINHGYVFADVAMAYDIFKLTEVTEVKTGKTLPLASYVNGSRKKPQVGSLLIWQEGGEFEITGHVAVVVAVADDYVRIAEQNFDHKPWPDNRDYSRELFARTGDDGSFWIRCEAQGSIILGWVSQGVPDDEAEVIEPPRAELFDLSIKPVEPPKRADRAWINLANEDEYAYASMNGQALACEAHHQNQYVAISQTAIDEIERATNELHALFLHATDYVFQNPHLLRYFNLPEVLWPRLSQSWQNRRNQLISGRFDFTLSQHGLKVYEYNADSASCHMECGKIQGLWSRHMQLHDGADPGASLYKDLVDAWAGNDMTDLVHVMLDNNQEENYHARFMQSAMESAGLRCKLIQGVKGLAWSDDGSIVDVDGVAITQVWKTWAWETALDQLRQELDDSERASLDGEPRQGPPKLMDVLFHPKILVIEPLWTLVPSNKAILPILWQMFPNHPYLLNSRFELTDDLVAQGYVSKPIAGRCGLNISVVDGGENTLVETDGRFGHQDYIYQALAPLPNINGINVQVCSFTAGGYYAGACTRVDESMIITNNSDILPMRILPDWQWD